MRFNFTPEQHDLAESLRRMLADTCPPEAIREMWSTGSGRSPEWWASFAEMGLPGIMVPEEYGGLGGNLVDLCLALEEVGRAAVPDAVVESWILAPVALKLGGSRDQQRQWLGRLTSGEARAGVSLHGRVVPDAHVSDLLIVAAGEGLRLLEPPGVTLTPLDTVDPSRRVFLVDDAPTTGAVLTLDARARAGLSAHEHVASAAVLVGVAQTLLDRTVEYVTMRSQFGRTIGSFQAVKHQLAHATSQLTLARLAVHAATTYVATGAAGGHDAAALARICAVDAEREVNRIALQLHGGVGFTWESDLQVWLKRGKALEQAHGGHRTLQHAAGAHAAGATEPRRASSQA